MTALYAALAIWGGFFTMAAFRIMSSDMPSHGGDIAIIFTMATLALTIGTCGLIAWWIG